MNYPSMQRSQFLDKQKHLSFTGKADICTHTKIKIGRNSGLQHTRVANQLIVYSQGSHLILTSLHFWFPNSTNKYGSEVIYLLILSIPLHPNNQVRSFLAENDSPSPLKNLNFLQSPVKVSH